MRTTCRKPCVFVETHLYYFFRVIRDWKRLEGLGPSVPLSNPPKSKKGRKKIFSLGGGLQGYYDTMDAGVRDPDTGDIMVMSREDDVINVAGHRLSTSAIEEVVLKHPAIVDAAVVGVPDKVKGQLPLVIFILSQTRIKGSNASVFMFA